MADYVKDIRQKFERLNPTQSALNGCHFNTDYVEWLEAYAYVLQRELDAIVSLVKDERQKHTKDAVKPLDGSCLDLEDTRTALAKTGGK
jgi:hypothetical protein